MENTTVILIVAAVFIELIPLVPKMVQFRIWVLHHLHWNCLADWHERRVKAIVLVIRLVLATLAAYFVGYIIW